MNSIILTNEELNRLRNRRIGSGTEANVYDAGKGILYKIYKPYDELLEELNYYDGLNISSVYSDKHIKTAIERQQYVTKTDLPKAPIYSSDKKFIGCSLKKHTFCRPMQSITMLPIKKQAIILKRLLDAVKELCDNYIYPHDLCVKEIDGKPHSNVLVTLNGLPKIIDLDGKSTIYTKDKSEQDEYLSYVTLTALINEILFDVDSKDDVDFYDIEWTIPKFESLGVRTDLAEKMLLFESDYSTIDQVLTRVLKSN